MGKKRGDLLHALLDRQKDVSRTVSKSKTVMVNDEPKKTAKKKPAKKKKKPLWSKGSGGTIVLDYKEAGGAIIVGVVLIMIAFSVGRYSAGTPGGTGGGPPLSTLSPEIPAIDDFSWDPGYTIQAAAIELTSPDVGMLHKLAEHLQGMGMEIVPPQRVGKNGVVYAGRASRADDPSLVNFRDWLRALPGPNGGKPFAKAIITRIPKQSSK